MFCIVPELRSPKSRLPLPLNKLPAFKDDGIGESSKTELAVNMSCV